MKQIILLRHAFLGAALVGACAAPAHAQSTGPSTQSDVADAQILPPIEVLGVALSSPYVLEGEPCGAPVTDAAELLHQVPGAAVNRNGSLTGIAQYRGLFGDRVAVQVDGIQVESGCTNAMDTPLSHAPGSQLESLSVARGIAPVSSGAETLGGGMVLRTRSGDFGREDGYETHARIAASGASVNQAQSYSALAWLANREQKFHVDLSRETADDTRYADGKVTPTAYDRSRVAVGYALRGERDTLEVSLARNATDASGTPALPMDILFSNADLGSLDFRHVFDRYTVHGALTSSRTEHAMTNYTLRAPPGGNTRRANTQAGGDGFRFDGSTGLVGGQLLLGLDGQLATHDAVIVDPNNAQVRIDNFNDVQRDRLGAFAEWSGHLDRDWSLLAGLRATQVSMDAGRVSHFMYGANPGVTALQDRFNQADRSREDLHLDWMAQLDRRLGAQTLVVAGVARKTRSPSYQERYLWIPLESTAGLADGNLYMGDLALDAEVAHQLELGLDWSDGRAWLMPRAFYQRIDDYIQGVPASDPTVIAVASGSGDATPLQYANVDAALYGIDSSYGIALGPQWKLDGVISYVRGDRRDIDDALYRIAPLYGTLAIEHRHARWTLGARSQFAAAQTHVSQTNGEQRTGGYAVHELFAGLQWTPALRVQAGIANLLDRRYAEHTAGINRVMDSDVALYERLPSPGRSLYATVEWSL